MPSTLRKPTIFLLILALVIIFSRCGAEKIKIISPATNLIKKNNKTSSKKPVIVKKANAKDNKEILYAGKAAGDEKNIEILLKNTSSSTWFKDLLPIFTLLLGIALKELIDNFSSRKRTRKIGKRWKAELEILVKPLEKQVNEIKNSVEHHKEKHNDPPRLVSIASLDCENFESLDKTELLNYINRYFIKDYVKAVSLAGRINLQISIIKSNSKSLKERYLASLEDAGKRHDKLNSNFQELIQSLHVYKNVLLNTEGMDGINGDKFKTIDILYGEQVFPHIQDGKFDYLKLESAFFTPLINELDRLSSDERTKEMASYTRKCLDNVAGIKMEGVYFTSNMNNHIKYFEQDIQELKKILIELDNTNKRFRIL